MANVKPICGVYNIEGQTFTQSGVDFRLIFSTRKHPTPTRSLHYLIAKPLPGCSFPDGRQYAYVSSLYGEEDGNGYQLEYEGKRYALTIAGNQAEIREGGKVL